MGQELHQKIAGLWTFPSDLVGAPEGSLAIADNIVIDRDNEAEPRRGFDYLTHAGVQSQYSNPAYRANKLFFYQNFLLSHYATSTLAYHDPTSGWTNYAGTFNPPTSTIKVRTAQSNQNLYLTTATGVQKLSSYNGTPQAIGAPQGLDVTTTGAVNVTPTGTTSSSVNPTVVTSVSSITGVAVGMTISGTNIPSNTVIVSFTATTITMSAAATGSASGTTLTIAAPGTWLAASSTAAYRVVWGYTDANQNLILGAPSQRSEYTNITGSQASVIVNSTIPIGITTANFYQVYRSAAQPQSTAGQFIEPSDELGLVYEGNPTPNDLANGYVAVVDIVPDALRGTSIYTAPSQLGLTASNYPPPLCYDLAVFRNCMWFGNTTGPQSFSVSLLGTGAPTGLQNGDTITIGGVVYTASTSAENAATGTFLITPVTSISVTGTTQSGSATIISVSPNTTGILAGMTVLDGDGDLSTGGYYVVSTTTNTIVMNKIVPVGGGHSSNALTVNGDSASQSIRDTALSLVRVINRYASSTVYALYVSAINGLPGQITLQARTVGQAAFTILANRSTCWSPALPTTVATTTSTSTADVWKNGLYYSQTLEPEAVPIGNYFRVGSADKNILRIIALRDSLFVLKEDGVFRISGTDPTNFTIWPLDYTNILIAPESAVALNNQIFALTGQGVVTIGETGVKIMSRPIESALTSLSTINYSGMQNASFGVAYESARAYYLFTVTSANDTTPTQWYRYNTITNAWVHGTLSKTCGGVDPVDDKLYTGNAGASIIDVERKSLTYSDYADYQSTQVISAVDPTGTILTISSSDTILIGSVIYQGPTVFGTVIATNSIAGTVTTSLPTTLEAGNADVLAPIQTEIEWLPASFNNPGYNKHIREVNLFFQSLFNGSGQVGFFTDVSPSEYSEPVAGSNVGSWGLFAWGGTAETSLGVNWGGSPQRKPLRVMVPRIHQRCTLITVNFSQAFCYSPYVLQGISFIGDLTSERTF